MFELMLHLWLMAIWEFMLIHLKSRNLSVLILNQYICIFVENR